MGSFDLAVELWRSSLNIDVSHPLILDMPMKLSLKLMASVSSNRMNAKGKFFD